MPPRAKPGRKPSASRGKISSREASGPSPHVKIPKAEPIPFKVKAIALGYYDTELREEGAEFALRDAEHFSPSWMVKV